MKSNVNHATAWHGKLKQTSTFFSRFRLVYRTTGTGSKTQVQEGPHSTRLYASWSNASRLLTNLFIS